MLETFQKRIEQAGMGEHAAPLIKALNEANFEIDSFNTRRKDLEKVCASLSASLARAATARLNFWSETSAGSNQNNADFEDIVIALNNLKEVEIAIEKAKAFVEAMTFALATSRPVLITDLLPANKEAIANGTISTMIPHIRPKE